MQWMKVYFHEITEFIFEKFNAVTLKETPVILDKNPP